VEELVLYLAGPMTGLEEYNYPAFHQAAKDLRGQNFEVCNPAEEHDGDQSLPRQVYMRSALENLLKAEAIVMLPGWQRSRGAIFELQVAAALELDIRRYVPGRPPAELIP